MFHSDGYDHRREECPNQEDTFTEDHQQDHSVHQEEVRQEEDCPEEVCQEEDHQEEVRQCLSPLPQLLGAEEMTS
jgi:hypothetical protein